MYFQHAKYSCILCQVCHFACCVACSRYLIAHAASKMLNTCKTCVCMYCMYVSHRQLCTHYMHGICGYMHFTYVLYALYGTHIFGGVCIDSISGSNDLHDSSVISICLHVLHVLHVLFFEYPFLYVFIHVVCVYGCIGCCRC